MYISLWENYRGHPDNISFMQFSTKIDGFEQKDSQGFENSYNSYEQYPLEKFFIFHHLPKLYFGFNVLLLYFDLFQLFKFSYILCIIFFLQARAQEPRSSLWCFRRRLWTRPSRSWRIS